MVNDAGYAEFNEKIDMKTYISVDPSSGKFVDKMASIEACLQDGPSLGTVDFNLASYAKPDKYVNKMFLKNTADGVSETSFIMVEVTTNDGSKSSN